MLQIFNIGFKVFGSTVLWESAREAHRAQANIRAWFQTAALSGWTIGLFLRRCAEDCVVLEP